MNKYLIFTGVGDNDDQWLSWAEKESAVYDRAINFYGKDDKVLEQLESLNLNFITAEQGMIWSKFADNYEHFKDYEYVLIADSDLLIRPKEIEEAFDRASKNNWSACTFSRDGSDYGFFAPIFKSTGSGTRQSNFVEMCFMIIRQDLLKLLVEKWFELELEYSTAIDIMLSNVAHNNNMMPFHVIDDYTIYNPHPTAKNNDREIDTVTETDWHERQKKFVLHMIENPKDWPIGEYITVGDQTLKRESLDDFRKIYNVKPKKDNMNVYCITPVFDPNIEYLKQNIESVRNQTHKKVKHILVLDGPQAKSKINALYNLTDIEIIELSEPHRDYGDTPRYIGTVSAFQRGADAVFWLDDDNWLEPNHVEQMIDDLSSEKPIATCQRNICNLEGEVMGLCFETDAFKFVDTNCYMIHKDARRIANVWWEMESNMHIFGDKVLYSTIRKNNIRFRHYNTPTVNYRTNFNFHYEHFGQPIPEGAKDGVGVQYRQQQGAA